MVPAFRDRRYLHSFGGGAVGTVLVWGAFALLYPRLTAPAGLDAPADRLVYAATLLAAPAALVGILVLSVALTRLVTAAFDPLKDAESRTQRINQRVLSNTVEQMAIFAPALLALAPQLDGRTVAALPLLVGLFILARFVFWAGYLIDPLYRATGMVMTLNVNAGTVAAAVFLLAG